MGARALYIYLILLVLSDHVADWLHCGFAEEPVKDDAVTMTTFRTLQTRHTEHLTITESCLLPSATDRGAVDKNFH